MLEQRNLSLTPLFGKFGQRRDNAHIAHRMVEILFDETDPVRFIIDVQPENSLIHFVPERDPVGNEIEMPHFFHVQDHRIGIFSMNRTAFDDRGYSRNLRHIPEHIIPVQGIAEPPCKLITIEEINRSRIPELVVREPVGRNRIDRNDTLHLVVIIDTAQDILLVRSLFQLRQNLLQPVAEQYFGSDVPYEILTVIGQPVVRTLVQTRQNHSFIQINGLCPKDTKKLVSSVCSTTSQGKKE